MEEQRWVSSCNDGTNIIHCWNNRLENHLFINVRRFRLVALCDNCVCRYVHVHDSLLSICINLKTRLAESICLIKFERETKRQLAFSQQLFLSAGSINVQSYTSLSLQFNIRLKMVGLTHRDYNPLPICCLLNNPLIWRSAREQAGAVLQYVVTSACLHSCMYVFACMHVCVLRMRVRLQMGACIVYVFMYSIMSVCVWVCVYAFRHLICRLLGISTHKYIAYMLPYSIKFLTKKPL